MTDRQIMLQDRLFYTQILTGLGWTVDAINAVSPTRGCGCAIVGSFRRGEEAKTSIMVKIRGYTVTVDGVEYQACVSNAGALALAEVDR